MKDVPNDQLTEILFTNLILDLSGTAMMAMGKIANPLTKQIERNMEMAEITIETLAALQIRSVGNLTEKEDALLTTTLTNLRLTFVKETERSDTGTAKEPE
jgi:hypothetical protein